MFVRSLLLAVATWMLIGALAGPALAKPQSSAAGASPAAVAVDPGAKSPQAPQPAQGSGKRLEKWDWVTLVAYFLAVLAVAWWGFLKNRDTADDYFLAGRNLGWFVVAASIFSSNIGSEHLVGLAGSGCSDGVAMAHYELHAWCLLVLAWVMVPFYTRSMVYTMPEFLEKRFTPTARWVLSVISLVAYVLTKLAVGIFAGGIVFRVLLPEVHIQVGGMDLDSFWVGSIVVVVLTGLYTVVGGLRAVAYTDTLQTLIFIAGSALVTVFGLWALAGWNGWAELRHESGSEKFNLWKPLTPAGVEGTWEPVIETGATPFTAEDIKDLASLTATLRGQRDEVSRFVWAGLSDEAREDLAAGAQAGAKPAALQSLLAAELNRIIKGDPIYDKDRFAGVTLTVETKNLLARQPLDRVEIGRLNQCLLQDAYPQEIRSVAGSVGKQAWYFNGRYPWLGMLFCAPIIGLWYWCTDQYIVQRALAAPNETIARRGSVVAGFMKLLPVFIFIIPGMISFALWKTNKLESLAVDDRTGTAVIKRFDPAVGEEQEYPIDRADLEAMIARKDPQLKNVVLKSNDAFALMVRDVLPAGLRGLVVAGLLSALMSSLAGTFNASSTLFTMDLYQRFRPKATQHQLVWTGRVATTLMVLIALAWIPVIANARGLYDYLQTVQGYLAPPIFVVFFLGVFMKRLNGKGCLAALIVGFILGVFRLAVDTPIKLDLIKEYPPGSLLWVVNHIYFQYYSLLIFLVSVVVMIAVSYMTAAPSAEKIQGLTYGTATPEQRRKTRESWSRGDVIASVCVVVLIAAAYLYFTG